MSDSVETTSRGASYGDDRAEPTRLEELVLSRLLIDLEAEGGSMSDGELQLHREFLRHRFRRHLENYRSYATPYALAFTILSLGAVLSGLLSSGIAAGWNTAGWARWTILILGLVAGTAAATTRLWRPGEKGSSRMRGANALVSEAWTYTQRQGTYGEGSAIEAFSRFIAAVSRIVEQTAAVDEARADVPQLPRAD
jgi:hypothetical protein